MTDSIRSGGVDADGEVTVGEDIVGRDKIVSNTSVYAGLAIGDMFRLRLVMSYERLWGLLEPLALYGRTAPFTVEAARGLSERLRRWYFEEAGGMYLHFSPELAAHTHYIKLQSLLQQIIDPPHDSAPAELSGSPFEVAQPQGHNLRQAMAQEIQHYMQTGKADAVTIVPPAPDSPSI